MDDVDSNEEALTIVKNRRVDFARKLYSDITGIGYAVDASAHQSGLFATIGSLKTNGICSSSGIFIKKTFIPFSETYGKGVTFKIGIANARTDAEKVLELVKKDGLPLHLVTTKVGT